MKYRGLPPAIQVAIALVVAAGLGAALGVSVPAGVAAISSALSLQHDRIPWYATRLLGILAYLAVAGSVLYGLLLSTKLLDAIAHRPVTFALHQDLASFGLGLAGVHGMLLALDRTMPFSLAGIVVPFAAPYRPLWVGIGQVALYLVLVVVASFYVRRHTGQRAWRLLHYTTFLAFAGSAAHGIATGTDSGTPWAWWMYALSITAVVFLFTYRIVTAVSARRHPASARRPIPVAAAAADRRPPAPTAPAAVAPRAVAPATVAAGDLTAGRPLPPPRTDAAASPIRSPAMSRVPAPR